MIGWLDCSVGVSGDMLLSALVDAGIPVEVMQQAVDAVSPEPVRLVAERVSRGGLAALHVQVEAADSTTRRTFADVRALLDAAPLADDVRARALSTFTRLAEAEGRVHGIDPDEVHFHEVGALDAIADVVGGCAGLCRLGLAELVVSPVGVGTGSVATEHGTLPVPPPAVADLLRGAPSHAGPSDTESATPTGVALVREWATVFGGQPAMTVSTIGVGAGGRDPAGHANVVRLLLGEPVASTDTVERLLEANVDDLDPRLWPDVLASLMRAGASDAWLTPILMKKGRPAHTVSVLVRPEVADAVRRVLFAESSTIGLREREVTKTALQRSEASVTVEGHPIRVKLATYAGQVVNAQPEYDDVAVVAEKTGRPAKSVLAQAVARTRELW